MIDRNPGWLTNQRSSSDPKTMYVLLPDGNTVYVQSLEEAAKRVRLYIEVYDLGASGWYTSKHVGNVYSIMGGACVAHVSYNGRVWNTEKTKEIL